MANVVQSGNNKINFNSNISGPSGNYGGTIGLGGPNSKTYPGMIAGSDNCSNKNTEEFNFGNLFSINYDNTSKMEHYNSFMNAVKSVNGTGLDNISATTIETENKEIKIESKYSNTEHSDMDNININQLRTLMVNFQNILNDVDPMYYFYFCNYCKGKKLSDIIDENGYIKDINLETNNTVRDNIFTYIKEKTVPFESADNFINAMTPTLNFGLDIEGELNKIISNSREDLKINGLSNEMLNSTIEEVIFNDSGYDAFVLKHPNGNYMIVNSSTNSKSMEDLAAIVYALTLNIFGSTDLLDFLFESVLVNLDIPGLSEEFLKIISTEGGIGAYCEKVYNGQINDNITLLEKYNNIAHEEGTQLELYGFSLGGGIMAAAYQTMINSHSPEIRKYNELLEMYNIFFNKVLNCRWYEKPFTVANDYIDTFEFDENKNIFRSWIEQIDDPIFRESFYQDWAKAIENQNENLANPDNNLNISSVTLYNPFMLYAQEYLDNDIGKLKDNDKLLIYSAQMDFVSLFYDHVEDFLDKTVYVSAGEVEPIDINNFSFSEIYEIIIGSSGNHGYVNIDKNSFDENGNLKNEGEFIGINDYIISILRDNGIPNFLTKILLNNKDKYTVNREFLLNSLFNFADIGLNASLGENAEYTNIIFEDIKNYVMNNYGNYNYTQLSNVLSESIAKTIYNIIDETDLVRDVIDNKLPKFLRPILTDFVVDFVAKNFDQKSCEDALNTFMKNEKESIQYVISLLVSGNKEEYNTEVKKLIDSFAVSYSFTLIKKISEEKIDLNMPFLGFNIGSYTMNLIMEAISDYSDDIINFIIKDQIVKKLERYLII